MKKPCIIFDIDGTLADLRHRIELIKGPHMNWTEFCRKVGEDTLIEQTAFLNDMFNSNSDLPIFIASGRGGQLEQEREWTKAWLDKNNISYDRIYMRKFGDFRADHIIKQEILEEIRADGYEPYIVFDDRQSVTDMWRRNGVFVLQCDPNPAEHWHDAYQFHEDWLKEGPLTIMVGPSGAGKSSFLERMGIQELVISSDTYRDILTGDFRDQTQNERVFEIMHEIADTKLRLGIPVILDATHIKNKDRITAAKLVPEHLKVNYIVIDRPLEEKRLSAGWRANVKVKDRPLVDYHHDVMKANIKDILKGDNLPNVRVKDLRVV